MDRKQFTRHLDFMVFNLTITAMIFCCYQFFKNDIEMAIEVAFLMGVAIMPGFLLGRVWIVGMAKPAFRLGWVKYFNRYDAWMFFSISLPLILVFGLGTVFTVVALSVYCPDGCDESGLPWGGWLVVLLSTNVGIAVLLRYLSVPLYLFASGTRRLEKAMADAGVEEETRE